MAPRLGKASLTLSCSFHVALTSLMLGVPAALVGNNPYYEQKAAGLAEDFALPAPLTVLSPADPGAEAAGLAALLCDPAGTASLAADLEASASQLRQRRLEVEVELLARLGNATFAALDEQAGALFARLRERAGEPAELHVQLAAMQTEVEELERVAGTPRLEAELRAQEAERRAAAAEERAAAAHATLASALGSRSWHMTAPLRRVGQLIRRRR
jgi:hypothetical protein